MKEMVSSELVRGFLCKVMILLDQNQVMQSAYQLHLISLEAPKSIAESY